MDALPETYRDTAAGAARRLLIDPETDLLSRRLVTEEVPDTMVIGPARDGWLRLEVTFQDSRHAEWALWQLATNAEALAPQWLRTALCTVLPRSPPATECHPES